MATSLANSAEMGFAEFASTLISETLNAIVTSQLTQEKQVAQLQQQSMLTPDEYARENLTDEIVRAEVLRLFPSLTDASVSTVDAGQPYVGNGKPEENPAIYPKVGYRIIRGDLTVEDTAKITANGYAHIFAATKTALANQHLAVLKTVIARGIPRVYVDNGRISSKLTLSFQETTTAPTSATTGSKIAGLGTRRIIAQPVSANRPEYLTLKTDVLSEVEITFKTVIP